MARKRYPNGRSLTGGAVRRRTVPHCPEYKSRVMTASRREGFYSRPVAVPTVSARLGGLPASCLPRDSWSYQLICRYTFHSRAPPLPPPLPPPPSPLPTTTPSPPRDHPSRVRDRIPGWWRMRGYVESKVGARSRLSHARPPESALSLSPPPDPLVRSRA